MVLVKSIKKFTEGLTARQKKTMNAHARHHSLKHMREMANAMKKVLHLPKHILGQ